MGQRPLCSVCIANYNGEGLIAACIDSVLSQGWGDKVEIIVHDDASTDDSAAMVRTRYPQVKMIVSTENVGFCIANNRMAALARGKYLLLLNNDAAVMPGALDALLEEARSLDRPAVLSLPQYDAVSGELLDRGCLLDPFLNPVPNHDPARSDVGMVMGACLWIPVSLWQEIGGFPEWFGSIGEDLYLCCLARLRGHPVRCTSSSGYHHHVGKSFGGGKLREGKLVTSFQRRRLSERNKTFVMVITFPTSLLLLMLPLHLLLLLLEGLMLSALARTTRYLTEIYWPVFYGLVLHAADLRCFRYAHAGFRRVGLRAFLSPLEWMPYKLAMLIRHGLPELK